MKKIFSRILSLLLCLAMLASMLVIPTYAINSVMDVPVKKGCYMTLETNKHSIEYMPGDDVVMTVRLFDPSGNQISAPYIRYNLCVDGSNETGSEYQLYWTIVPFRDGEYTIKTKAIDIPGFMRLRVDILDENQTVINRKYTASEGDWTEFGPASQLSFFQGGIVVDVENIRTTASTREGEQVGDYTGATYDEYGIPSDFMTFWDNAISELDANPPKLIEFYEITSSYYGSWHRANHNLYAYKISCPGDPTDLKSGDTYVSGAIAIPKNADPGTAPIGMFYCGYGISIPGLQGSADNKGKIAMVVGAHSLDYDFETRVQPTSDDFNLHDDQYGASNYYGFSFTENQERDDIYFKYMLLRDIQAVRFATQVFRDGGTIEFDESASEETKALATQMLTPGLWDGENITSRGSSQGAFQSVAVAALYKETIGDKEQRITELYAGIPWMCDVQGNTDPLKVQSTYRQQYEKDGVEADGLNYYDTTSFGRYVKCDTVISAGMGDPLCPASGVSALYNNIRMSGADIDITLGFTQGRTHSTNDNSAKHAEEKIFTYKTTEKVVGYTDADGNFEASVADGVLSIYSMGDDKVLTGTASDAFVTYLADYASSITTVKIIGKFAEIGDTQYMFGALDSVTTMLIDYKTNTIGTYNTTTYAGNFIGMSKLVNFGHVEFDSAGNVVEGSRYNTYEEGVCDLRGFDYVINHTSSDSYNTLPPCIFRSTAVKKVIMPDSLMCGDTDVAGKLPKNGFSLCLSLTEVVVPASVEVSTLGQYFIWKDSKVRTIRFEGGVTADFSVGGKGTGSYPTNDGVISAVIYCPSQADVDIVSAALTAVSIDATSITAALIENTGFTIAGGVLTIPHNGDTGIARCDATWYDAMNGVTEVIIEDGYDYLGANILDMTTVTTVHIPESVTSISADCFGGVTDFTIVGTSGSYAQTFAEANGIAFKKEASVMNAVTADGFNVRIKDYTGLRGLFSFSESIEAENKALGYTLVEYGALACSETKYAAYGYDPEAIYDASAADKYLRKIVVEGEGGVNRFVDSAKKQFCISLVGIPTANYLSGVYMCGYCVWTDGENEYFFATEYTPSSGEEHYAPSLYELTLFGFKNGLVNSETMEDVCLWNVLETQAVTLDSFNESAYTFKSTEYPVTADKGYTLAEDGSFTFKNIPLLDYIGCDAGKIAWNYIPNGLETESSTGIEWSLIPDGEDYIAVFRRADGLADDFEALMPRQTNDEHTGYYFAHLPIHESWGCLVNPNGYGTYAINSPRIEAAEIAKIKTVVLDYGINGHEAVGLGFLSDVTTVVYPNDYTGVASYAFNGSRNLKNIIWANDGIPHMDDVEGIPESESLADMRGMEQLKTARFFYNCSAIENVVFSSLSDSEAKIDSLFMALSSVKRGWMSNASANSGVEIAPAEYVIDMRGATNATSLVAGAFEMGATVRTIYLPATIKSFAEKTGYGNNMALGNGRAYKFYTESDDFKTALAAYYTHVTTKFTGTSAQTLDKITINDMTISEYLGLES